jgi:DNA-binding NarL/FixJ family response regulator
VKAQAAPDQLSERELEVLRLVAAGKSNPEIAKELFITRNTVQNHVSSILIKTNLSNRAQAAVYAKEHGIV